MRPRVVDAFMRLLPLDPRAARAIDETLRDWDHEAGEATSAGGRGVAHLRGFAAWLSAMTRVAIVDLRGWPSGGFLLRLAVILVPAALLILERMIFIRDAPTAAERGALVAMMSTNVVSLLLPLALLLTIVWQGPRRPIRLLGAITVGVMLAAIAQAELVPRANEAFRDRVSLRLTTRPTPVPRGAREWHSVDFVKAIFTPARQFASGSLVRREASLRLALVIWTGTCIWLGAAVVRRRRRWWWVAGYFASIVPTAMAVRAFGFTWESTLVIVALAPLGLLPWVACSAASLAGRDHAPVTT